MESIASMVAESIARRVKAAQAEAAATLRARAEAGDPQARAMLARLRAPGSNSGSPAPQGAPASAGPPPPRVPVRPVPPPAVAPPSDAFPGLPLAILEVEPIARPDLLNSFSGAGLLSAIVLSEALAKPVALRNGGSGGGSF